MPNEFDPDTAMGLFANLPAIESAHTLATAKAIAIALGDSHGLAGCVYAMTGNPRLAQRVEIKAQMERNHA